MADPELAALASQMAVAILVQAALAVGLFAWGRWVARRQRGTWWRWAAWMPLGALVIGVVGVGLSVLLLVQAFGSVAAVDPALRAARLSEGIGRAMIPAAAAPFSWALYVVSIVAFVVGSVPRRR